MLESIAAGRVLSVYAMNFPNDGTTLHSFLKDVPYHIDPAVNPALTVSPGINIPSYYLSGGISFSEMYPEDGYLDSINAVHWGEAGAEKIWLFVNPAFSRALCKDACLIQRACRYESSGRGCIFVGANLPLSGESYKNYDFSALPSSLGDSLPTTLRSIHTLNSLCTQKVVHLAVTRA